MASFCHFVLQQLAFSEVRHLAGIRIPPIPWPMTLSAWQKQSIAYFRTKDYVGGAKSHAERKKRDGNRFLTEQRSILREQGQAEFIPLKMEAIGFGKGANMGL